jgi:hypothetical protein
MEGFMEGQAMVFSAKIPWIVGAARRFNWGENSATARGISSTGMCGHCKTGKATHTSYDIFQASNYIALTRCCMTLGTTLCTNR